MDSEKNSSSLDEEMNIQNSDEKVTPEGSKHTEDSVLSEDTAQVTAQSDEEAVPLESLLYDSDEVDTDARETPEESSFYDNFLSEYKQMMSSTLEKARELRLKEQIAEEKKEIRQKEADRSAQRLSKGDSTEKTDEENPEVQKGDYLDEITLAPEEYEDPGEKYNIFRAEPLPEEEADEGGFSIGEDEPRSESEDAQLSFRFDLSDEKPVADTKRDEDEDEYDPDHPKFLDSVFDFLELFVFTLLAVMVITSFFVKHSIVEGDSMNNTLKDGEHLLITDVFYTPERGDIIVFEDYSTFLRKAVVKRVIGIPGDTVEIKLVDEFSYEVYINGNLLEEDYAYNAPDFSTPVTGVWEIGEGEVFVMGDNRYNSTDSRHEKVGPIDIDSILGKVIFRFYPFDKFGTVD